MFLQKTHCTPLSFQKRIFAISIIEAFKNIHFLPQFYFNISNKYQSSNLAKYQYFYTRQFTSLLLFEKKFLLFITNVFRNIHFLPHFHYFEQWMRFVILQINADFLVNQLKIFFYTRLLIDHIIYCTPHPLWKLVKM